ncbi:MAG: hypothetical protein ABSC94_27775 [Polyangiaceae bacterium]|jgi:hypothetical protein
MFAAEVAPGAPPPSLNLSIDYRGLTRARLAVHRVGDGPREYCIDGYASGERVEAKRLRAECGRSDGERLASFEEVDKIMLEVPAGTADPNFDICITSIAVADLLGRRAGAGEHGLVQEAL